MALVVVYYRHESFIDELCGTVAPILTSMISFDGHKDFGFGEVDLLVLSLMNYGFRLLGGNPSLRSPEKYSPNVSFKSFEVSTLTFKLLIW